jgi:hypothetical protein
MRPFVIGDCYTADQMYAYALTALEAKLALEPLTEDEIIDAVNCSDLDWHRGWTLEEGEPNRYVKLARAIEQAHVIAANKETK